MAGGKANADRNINPGNGGQRRQAAQARKLRARLFRFSHEATRIDTIGDRANAGVFRLQEPVFPTVRFLASVAEDKNHPESIR
jgi:hypothetical protein